MFHPLVIDEGTDDNGVEHQGSHAPKTGEVKMKCTDCEKVTEHSYFRIQPVDDEPGTTIINSIHLHKKLLMCTGCGKLALKK